MTYVTYEYYSSLYGANAISETDFNRLGWEAEREIDKVTSGVDNVPKLQVAFPTNDTDAEIVRRCVCSLVDFLKKMEVAEIGTTYTKNADGTVHSNVVSSISAGNESISYSASENAISTAMRSIGDRNATIYSFIESKLYGVSDANGVNLLYAGRYPYYVEV